MFRNQIKFNYFGVSIESYKGTFYFLNKNKFSVYPMIFLFVNYSNYEAEKVLDTLILN